MSLTYWHGHLHSCKMRNVTLFYFKDFLTHPDGEYT